MCIGRFAVAVSRTSKCSATGIALAWWAILAVSACCWVATSAAAATPEETLRSFRLADGFEISLVAAEPDVRQPVAMNFDERGRLWVVQYLQYPDPAGLKKVKVDQYMRTRFDRVPEPPPRGPKGKDRITICEDTDGDGRADKFKDFASGLNMATGVAVGYGGVFVAQSPYLLYYADRDRDDAPDGDPQVLVAGFGMEDSHAYPNSLQIGPDGWLYGAQGSNVWAKVAVTVDEQGRTYTGRGIEGLWTRGLGLGKDRMPDAENHASPQPPAPSPRFLEFNQCIWRYHPPTGRFEVFAEGGGNTWGVDFNQHGEIIAGTNFGGVCGLHMVQGGYYVKGFAKHGPLSNPHAYGYFEHMPYATPAKITQGEHVMCGGIVYQGGAFGPEIENQYITCALLHRAIYWHKLIPDRSTYKSDFGGALVTTDDPEFRPVDLALAPDGSVYIADWADVRANHVIPEDTWNKTNGRIYRLAKKGTPRAERFDLAEKTSAELVKLLEHPNAWHRREAVRLLGERGELEFALKTDELALASKDANVALAALWASNRLVPNAEVVDEKIRKLLEHENEYIRAWAVRLIGDRGLSDRFGDDLVALAKRDPSLRVRAQLASTAAIRSTRCWDRVVAALAARDEDADDPHIPLLLWWAIESHVDADREAVVGLFSTPEIWSAPLVRKHLIERAARRFVVQDTDAGYAACAALWNAAATAEDVALVTRGLESGLAGRRLESVPQPLVAPLAALWERSKGNVADVARYVRFAVKLGDADAYQAAAWLVADKNRVPEKNRIELVQLLGEAGRAECVPALLDELVAEPSDAMHSALLSALARYDDPRIAAVVLASLGASRPAAARAQTLTMLASRASWSLVLLDAVAQGQFKPSEITADLVRVMQLHGNAELNAKIEKHVGKFSAQTSAEKQEQIDRVARLLAAGSGDAAHGKAVFAKTCGICHTLHGEGNKIGPDLTTADRGNRSFMLANVVDPNLGLRQEYVATTIRTVDGQVITGIVIERTDAGLALVDAKNVEHRVANDEIDEMKAAEQSLMPEKVLDPLSETEVRDLFAYLEAGVRRTDNRRSIVSTFDAGIDEFAVVDNGDRTRPDHQPSGGASGGFLVLRDSGGADMKLVAPLAYRGDLTSFTDGMAWFDAKTIDVSPTSPNGGQPHPVFGTLAISDGKTTLRQDLFHPTEQVPTSDWLRFSGRLTAEAFHTDAATFAAVMGHVTQLTVTVEAFSNARETIGVDNFTLQAK